MGNNKCYNLANVTDLERAVFSHTDSTCVFISHKKEDEEAAKAIGNFLSEIVGVSIYIDTEDCVLQEIQQKYPHYDDLVEDLISTDNRMIEYKKLMKKIAFAE